MFASLLASLMPPAATLHSRPNGIAFLRVAQSIYNLKSLGYIALNILHEGNGVRYVHCAYSDENVLQYVTHERISTCSIGLLAPNRNDASQSEWEPLNHAAVGDYQIAHLAADHTEAFIRQIPAIRGETAAIGFMRQEKDDGAIQPDLFILGQYLHNHILRMNGHDSAEQILINAREIDCLKWTAEGKTAWEASVILGISERTVRFHLNSAREKLNCVTTTQAVAKAVAAKLIEL